MNLDNVIKELQGAREDLAASNKRAEFLARQRVRHEQLRAYLNATIGDGHLFDKDFIKGLQNETK